MIKIYLENDGEVKMSYIVKDEEFILQDENYTKFTIIVSIFCPD